MHHFPQHNVDNNIKSINMNDQVVNHNVRKKIIGCYHIITNRLNNSMLQKSYLLLEYCNKMNLLPC